VEEAAEAVGAAVEVLAGAAEAVVVEMASEASVVAAPAVAVPGAIGKMVKVVARRKAQ